MPVSVPAKSRSLLTVSWRTARTKAPSGMPFMILRQVLP